MSPDRGTGHLIQQRLTALIQLPLIIFFVWLLLTHIGATRAELLAAFRNPWVTLPAIAAILSITWHMRLGVQAVLEDYVTGERTLKFSLALNTLFALIVAVAALSSVLWLALGA